MIFLRGKGIIIAKKDIEEADRYITIFMEDYGKVSTVIKGIRKSKKRDKTAVDILSLTDFQFYKKNDSLVISNFSTVKDYIGIKSDIDKINIAFYIFSILNQILVENGRNRKIYEVLEKTLDYLNISSDERKNYLLILFFLNTIIKEEGISIENSNNIEELQVDLQNQRRVEIEANVKEILQYLFQDNLKVVINDEKYKIDYVRKAILVLENYINFHLDTNINAQKILWGGFNMVNSIKITDYITEDLVDLDLKSKNREGILIELSELLEKSPNITGEEKDIYKALVDREKLGSTGIGKGVAIPHAKTESATGLTVAFGVSKEGIDFNSLDEEEVHLFFVFASPNKDSQIYLKVLARISRLIREEEFRESLFNCKTPKEVIDCIREKEEN